MAILVQLTISVILGVVGGFATSYLGYDRPWPVIVGCVVFLACMGCSVLIVDGDGW